MENLVREVSLKLPEEVSLLGMIQSRYSEINQLIADFKSKSPKLISQKLPIHMRRRAASHNINRLPSRTRRHIIKKNQGKQQSTATSESKEKKRKQHKKYRNKSKLSLNHAVREAKPDRCLLHIWFVKRFKMISEFNQLLPDYNTTKNRRKLHRMSNIGCVHYYFPHQKCITISFRSSGIGTLIQGLSRFTHDDLKGFFNCSQTEETRSKNIHIFQLDGYPDKVFGPGQLIYLPNHGILLIWCHTQYYSEFFNLLQEVFKDNEDVVPVVGEKFYQLFRMFGSESLQHLKKVLGDCGSGLPETFEDGKIIALPNWRFQPDSDQMTRPSGIMEVDDDNGVGGGKDFLIVEMEKFTNRQSIRLTVPYQEAKSLWYSLVKNRCHLVGGLRDLKILSSDLRCIQYPYFGFPDLEKGCNSEQNLWSDLMKNNTGEADYFLLRDSDLIQKLKDPGLSVGDISTLLELQPRLKNALIYVELICINRGVPEKGDIICLPNKDDVTKYVGKEKIDLRLQNLGYGPDEVTKLKHIKDIRQSSRKVIGFVEYGHFSLDLGAGKSMGAITLLNLKDLIEVKQSSKLLALIRPCKSTSFRFVEVIIDNFVIF